MQMKVLEERIESIYAKYFKVIEALKEKNDDLLSGNLFIFIFINNKRN